MNQRKAKQIRRQVTQLLGAKLPMVNYETITHAARIVTDQFGNKRVVEPLQTIMTNCIRKNVKLTKRNYNRVRRGATL